jgi:hypothetical protein
MRGAGVHQIRHRQLVDMAEPLKWPRIKYPALLGIEVVEYMDGITDLVDVFCHPTFPRSLKPT